MRDIDLKPFQTIAVRDLLRDTVEARQELARGHKLQALLLNAPTGSGKTVMTIALMEKIINGDPDVGLPGDPKATFLWLTDLKDLNEQTRQKFAAHSSAFGREGKLIVVSEDTFDEERLASGNVYFINTQKLGAGNLLTARSPEKREYTFWETITNTITSASGSFWLILDEAHRGMNMRRADSEEAATIAQGFLNGDAAAGLLPAPLVLGVTATPQRFEDLLIRSALRRTERKTSVDPIEARSSGLLKKTVRISYATGPARSDLTFLASAAGKLGEYDECWDAHTSLRGEARVQPLLVVQVGDKVAKTTLLEMLDTLDPFLGDGGTLSGEAIAHTFEDHQDLEVGRGRVLRYVGPSSIQGDSDLRVVFFKSALTTGWDCPRAEVMMSFRPAQDETLIAQLVGRMVRTPRAETVAEKDPNSALLNSVWLFLPHYDQKAIRKTITALKAEAPDLEFPEDDQVGDVGRNADLGAIFEAVDGLPSYEVPQLVRLQPISRLLSFASQLKQDGGLKNITMQLVRGHWLFPHIATAV